MAGHLYTSGIEQCLAAIVAKIAAIPALQFNPSGGLKQITIAGEHQASPLQEITKVISKHVGLLVLVEFDGAHKGNSGLAKSLRQTLFGVSLYDNPTFSQDAATGARRSGLWAAEWIAVELDNWNLGGAVPGAQTLILQQENSLIPLTDATLAQSGVAAWKLQFSTALCLNPSATPDPEPTP